MGSGLENVDQTYLVVASGEPVLQKLNFYRLKSGSTLVSRQYGNQDEHGNWNGMIKEVMIGVENGGADFAIADLSITTSRASAVTFSMPWMNLGKN